MCLNNTRGEFKISLKTSAVATLADGWACHFCLDPKLLDPCFEPRAGSNPGDDAGVGSSTMATPQSRF